jgi:hypothetical protein
MSTNIEQPTPHTAAEGHDGAATCLLSSAYFPPVQWMQKLHRYGHAIVERCDNFTKQTYRNRCLIATANGVQALTVPIERYDGAKCPMRDIRISDHGEWRHLHWNAIVSAYGESPFFMYYADDLRPFFERRWEYLFDFNMEITAKLCELLDVRPNISVSDEYMDAAAVGADDFRLRGKELFTAFRGHIQNLIQLFASKRGHLGRPLDFNKASIRRHHHVHIHQARGRSEFELEI